MADLLLRSFQPVTRVVELQREGVLVGDWQHVLRGNERAYARMVEVMSEHGIDTGGRPPIWAWSGPLRLADADSLLDAEQELSRGFATVTFRAPEHLVLLSDYGSWCNTLMAPGGATAVTWQPRRPEESRACDRLDLRLEQACLPHLCSDWVTGVEALPTTGWDSLDLDALIQPPDRPPGVRPAPPGP